MMRARDGSALILVLLMTLAIAGLSIAAIFMSSSAGLLSAFYDRERDFQLAADAGLEIVRSRLVRDTALAIPDTGMRQLLAGAEVFDAAGQPIRSVRVNVYAAATGDTSGTSLPLVTLVAAAYDSRGTRHVRRLDLRRESFSRYAIFANVFPLSQTHGPGTVEGRVHTNDTWRSSSFGNLYRDTVSAVVGVTGTATYESGNVVGVPRVRYPRDSTFPRLDTLAAAANLAFLPVSGFGSASGIGSRLEFVAFDADNDGTVEAHEGFARIFDVDPDVDTTRLRISTSRSPSGWSHTWSEPVLQNQCGAAYLRAGRWHFFPVSTHRAQWARAVIKSTALGDYPFVDSTRMAEIGEYTAEAVREILTGPTARCYPAGSPFLMTSERATDSAGVVQGDTRDVVPFGIVTPPGGWPASAPYGYGGNETTFTANVHTCAFSISNHTGQCQGTQRNLGRWRAFAGTAVTGISSAVRQGAEAPYLWPLSPPYNPAGRGVISARAGPLFVSGVVRGRVTLRVDGRVALVDRLRYETDPNDPAVAPCENELGVLARGDVLVVEGMATRVRRIGRGSTPWVFEPRSTVLGGEPRFTVHGHLMSLGGTVGVENADATMGAPEAQLPCPDDGGGSTASNGGCLAITGGVAMQTYSALYTATQHSGFRYLGSSDRCQRSGHRPPFFPLTNRLEFVRTLEIEPSRANTPARIRSLLLRLKGKSL